MTKPHTLPQLQVVSPHTALWHFYDSAVKAELYSTLISTKDARYLIDPTPLFVNDLAKVQPDLPIGGIIVTNQNHWRAAGALADELSVPIFAHPAAHSDEAPKFTPLTEEDGPMKGMRVIAVEGAATGEIALFSEMEGTLIIGDALINFEPYGFTFLPPKYCTDHKLMRRSLRRLETDKVRQIFFAHGLPIIAHAAERLTALVQR